MRSKIQSLLRKKHFPYFVIGIAFLLSLSTLFMGMVADDYIHYAFVNGSEELASKSIPNVDGEKDIIETAEKLFVFIKSDKNNSTVSVLSEIGFYPWWGDPELKLAFFRPLSAMTHWLDYKIWPNNTALMHLQSIFWFILTYISALYFYRTVFGKNSLISVAMLLLVFDLSFYESLGWLASRNALIALTFGILSITFLFKNKDAGGVKFYLLSIFSFTLGLLSAEAGVGAFAFILSFYLFIDKRKFSSRILSGIPFFIVIVVWRVGYQILGYGAQNNAIYIDPGRSPVEFFESLFSRAPIILFNQFAAIDNVYGSLSPDAKLAFIIIAYSALLSTIYLFRKVIFRNRLTLFFFASMIFAVIPPSAMGMINGRLQLFASVSGMALLALTIQSVFARSSESSCSEVTGLGYKIFTGLVMFVNIIVPAVFLFVAASYFVVSGVTSSENKELAKEKGILDKDLSDKNVYVINSPNSFHLLYLPYQFSFANKTLPNHMRTLSPGFYDFTVKRVDENRLRLVFSRGMKIYPQSDISDGQRLIDKTLYTAKVRNNFFSGFDRKIDKDFEKQFDDVSVTVIKTNANREPVIVDLQFNNIEANNNLWYYWNHKEGKYLEFDVPSIGNKVVVNGMISE